MGEVEVSGRQAVPSLRVAEHTCASRHPRSHPTFQVLDFLHVNLQLLFELPLVLLQLFHQFFKVLKAEGSSVRTDLILPRRAGWDPGPSRAHRQPSRRPGPGSSRRSAPSSLLLPGSGPMKWETGHSVLSARTAGSSGLRRPGARPNPQFSRPSLLRLPCQPPGDPQPQGPQVAGRCPGKEWTGEGMRVQQGGASWTSLQASEVTWGPGAKQALGPGPSVAA